MIYYIDCEFNGFQGELISMALVSKDGREFYEVLPFKEYPNDWVLDNVMPVLNKEPISIGNAWNRLYKFLNKEKAIHIVADHPADIKYLCEFLQNDKGGWMPIPPISFEIRRHCNYVSKIPHNALEDARAIKEYYEQNPNYND